ncbi:3-hydroxyacyl-ACP dehydratase FabZ [Desulfobacter vibrioformis]|uniref:3-hydroxyacyl-ACP dehydratase FabZ n=1 Tax=Desulfobacter vibrioformis TaxID=34031 RepID=UPI00069064C2|nr:3-hydroxyacyl-ACP dehydratase FabZ [Desulfobacter vibrioformis]
MGDTINYLPQRAPFLFIDSILYLGKDRVTATYRVKTNEYFFKGHFPDKPVMPGVILLEMMFQAGAVYVSRFNRLGNGDIPVIARVENAKFKKMVKPGESLLIEVSFMEKMNNAFFFKGKIQACGQVVASCDFRTAVVPGIDAR